VPLVVGIDEAGYGPMLGPLVVAATVWNVRPQHADADLWQLLRGCVSRSAAGAAGRLTVNDSKSVYGRKRGLSALERPVLAFATAAGLECRSLSGLLRELGVRLEAVGGLPWYRDLDLRLPVDQARSGFQAIAQRLTQTMAGAGAFCGALLAEVVAEDRFNQRVAATRNKAAVLVEHVLRLIDAAAARGTGQDVIVRVDRLGGRADYRRLLAAAFSERHVHVMEVSRQRSRYRLATADNDWFVEFCVGADGLYLPVALASMLAKYLRELLMLRFNEHWRARLPTLRPTAGYYSDAQRFLADIAPLLAEAGLPAGAFVRCR